MKLDDLAHDRQTQSKTRVPARDAVPTLLQAVKHSRQRRFANSSRVANRNLDGRPALPHGVDKERRRCAV